MAGRTFGDPPWPATGLYESRPPPDTDPQRVEQNRQISSGMKFDTILKGSRINVVSGNRRLHLAVHRPAPGKFEHVRPML